MSDLSEPPTGFGPRPREFLDAAQICAIEIRKLLRQGLALREEREAFASAADALLIAELIEQLCEVGRHSSAEDAIVIAEQVETLIDRLWTEIDFSLAACNHRAKE